MSSFVRRCVVAASVAVVVLALPKHGFAQG